MSFKGRAQLLYIYTKFEMLLYFKALMEREKERRAFIVMYIWVFFWYICGFLFSYIWDSILHITLDSIYGFLNTILIHVTLDYIYGSLSKRINIY
jgi:cyanate permease